MILQQLQVPPTYHTTPRSPCYFSNTTPHLPLPIYHSPFTMRQVSHEDLWYGTITPESIAFGAEERLPEEVANPIPIPNPIP